MDALRPTLAVAVLSLGAASASGSHPTLIVKPAIVDRGAPVTVTVSGLAAAPVGVRLVGSTRWQPLSRRSGRWSAALHGPPLLGVYLLELRSHGKVYRSWAWMLRVFPSGALARPSFATPAAVAAWWARTVPRPRSRLVAIRPWPLPAGDRRDPRLHRLLVIAYARDGDRNVNHRLGIWITSFRDGYQGGWRLLQATVEPPGPCNERRVTRGSACDRRPAMVADA